MCVSQKNDDKFQVSVFLDIQDSDELSAAVFLLLLSELLRQKT